MPSTYTTRIRAEKQAAGENNNSWGTLLNTDTIDIFDEAWGMSSYTLSAPKTLTTGNGATDEARRLYQNITGGTGGTITIPNVEKAYFVRNASSGTVTFTTGSGTTCTVAAGTNNVVVCEGGNVCRTLFGSVASSASAADITAGTLAVARGGTGVTTSTGSTNNVLSASPTLTGNVTIGDDSNSEIIVGRYSAGYGYSVLDWSTTGLGLDIRPSGGARVARITSSGVDVTGNVIASTYTKVGSYTVAGVPSAATAGAGAIIYVSNESGGATTAFSDGTNWRRHADRAVIS